MALLYPFNSLAQCLDVDWYSENSALPQGVMWGSAQNPMLASSEFDDAIYFVSEFYNASDLLIGGSNLPVSTCGGNGRGFSVQRYAEDGAVEWHRNACFSFNGTVNGVAADDQGGVYVCGSFNGLMVFDGVEFGTTSTAGYFLLKLDSEGDLLWHETGDRSAAVGATWTPNGLLFCLAVSDSVSFNGTTFYNESGSPNSDRDNVILLIDSARNVVWHRIMTGIDNPTVNVNTCNEFMCIVQGRFDVELIYDGETITTEGFSIYQIAFNLQDGSRLWLKKTSPNETGGIFPNSSKLVGDSLFVTVGLFHEQLVIDGYSITETTYGSDGYIMLQSAQNGSVHWLNGFGGDREDDVLDVAMTPSNNSIVVSGAFASEIVNYQGTVLLNHLPEKRDPFILEIDLEGKPKCVLSGLGTQANDNAVRLAITDSQLSVVMSFQDSTAFGNHAPIAMGFNDVIVWKTCLPCDTLTSIAETIGAQPVLMVFPNPASQSIRLQVTGNRSPLTGIAVTDMLGHAVLNLELRTLNMELNVSTLATGIYTLTATLQNGETLRQRLKVQRP